MAEVWKIAPGNRAEDWPVFSKHGCIGIGWLGGRDFRDFNSEDQVLEALEQEYGKGTQGCGKGAAEMIWSFVDEIRPNQIVVANDGYNRTVGIGIVESEYIPPRSHENPLRNDGSTHRHHVHLVNWIIRKPADVPGKRFFVQRTLKPLDDAKVDAVKQAYLIAYPDDSEIEEQLDQLFGGYSIPGTPKASDINDAKTEKVLATTYRILRDTELARRVKVMHNYECQICGHTIVLTDGSRYAEAHHIKPLGSPYDGPDIMANILCLCPNHHAECDLGVNELSYSALRRVDGHDVDESFIEYHNGEIHASRNREL
ncbi:MAG: HNH endonuclease [Planctomycetota bacterium]